MRLTFAELATFACVTALGPSTINSSTAASITAARVLSTRGSSWRALGHESAVAVDVLAGDVGVMGLGGKLRSTNVSFDTNLIRCL